MSTDERAAQSRTYSQERIVGSLIHDARASTRRQSFRLDRLGWCSGIFIVEHQALVVRVVGSDCGLSSRRSALWLRQVIDHHGAFVLYVAGAEQYILASGFDSTEEVHSTTCVLTVLLEYGDPCGIAGG
jgi:hypothetical protein